jgi:hypothetical protein
LVTPKKEMVKQQLNYWLTGCEPLTDLGEPAITMLDFWKQQPDCLLKQIALRAGSFMISQCATERANKIPKEIWSQDRASLTSASMARDLFVNLNLDRFPECNFKWENVGKDAKKKLLKSPDKEAESEKKKSKRDGGAPEQEPVLVEE